jgi:hypothetical protein
MIDQKIAELQKQQSSKSKYLNAQVILGLLTAGLTKKTFTVTTSYQCITAAANFGEALTREVFNQNAPHLNHSEQIVLAQALKNQHDQNLWKAGAIWGTLTGILALISIKQLYNGLTTKNLKNNYAKALAIKALLQQAPTQ